MIVKLFQDKQIRIIASENGEVWFVAKDVCDTLGLGNGRDVLSRLDVDEKSVSVLPTFPDSTQLREMNIVSESGLYKIIFQSKKPEAKKFTNWVTKEVLPSLRKHGTYTLKDVSQIIAEENNKYEKDLETINSDINKYFISLSNIAEFREYNSLLSQKKGILDLITENNKAIKINARHKNKISALDT